MANILLINENEKEAEILKVFLQQASLNVIPSKTSYANYLRLVQYKPHVILLEMPASYSDQINYIHLIRKNKQIQKTPVICFGDHTDSLVVKSFLSAGANLFLNRPLKAGKLLQEIQRVLPDAQKSAPAKPQGEDRDRAADIQFLLNKDNLATRKIDMMAEYVNKLLAFPFTIAKVLKITERVDSGAEDLARAIRADPVITATLLRVSNSVLFASRDHRITNVQEAIVRVGFKETKNIAMSLAIMKIFSKEEKNAGFDRVDFWYHSLGAAVIAEKIARTVRYPHPEEAFIAGLLHDFGILLLDEFFGDIFAKVLERASRYGSSFIHEEFRMLGITHGDVAEKLFINWQMPQSVAFSMKYHPGFLTLENGEEPQHVQLAKIVGLADMLVKCSQIGRGVDLCVHPVPNALLAELKFPNGFGKSFFDDVCQQINLYNSFLEIDPRIFPVPGEGMEGADSTHVVVVDRETHYFNPFEMYLRAQGYKITRTSSPVVFANLTDPPRVILLLGEKPDKPEALQPYLEVMRNSDGEKGSKSVVETVPVIYLQPIECTMGKLHSAGIVKQLQDSLDLRNLNHAIFRLVGKVPDTGMEMPDFMVRLREKTETYLIAEVDGVIRVGDISELKDFVLSNLEETQKWLLLDLEELDFVDSSAIRLLVNLHKKFSAKGGKLCILRPSAAIAKILNAVHLDAVFGILRTDDEIDMLLGRSKSAENNPILVQEPVAAKG